jgi:uncharacterized membrane protein YgaE (UPF0421/DUF939 family)
MTISIIFAIIITVNAIAIAIIIIIIIVIIFTTTITQVVRAGKLVTIASKDIKCGDIGSNFKRHSDTSITPL